MSTILDKIIESKKKEIAELKPMSSIERFRKEGFFWNFANRSLVETLSIPGSSGIIAEFKRKSPSKGWFKPKELEVEKVVRTYNDAGAAGMSILTDEPFFGGDLDDLIQAKVISDIPILRKDFIIDEWQIAEAKAFGADVILLIAACLSPEKVRELATFAKTIGLEVLLEIHDDTELGHICEEVDMVGVNNRNLKTFEVDVNTSLSLIRQIPKDKPAVAESGIQGVETILTLREAGFKGFLVGERFMKEEDPAQSFRLFVEELRTKFK
jgi:indole-3-glycerol phosphate synthase